MRILFVDDESGIRALASTVLRAKGFDVVLASDASSALEAHESASPPFSLLIADIGLPDMRGDALASRIRENSPTLPVVFLSGLTQSLRGVNLCTRTRVLTKPFEMARLLAAVKDSLATDPAIAEQPGVRATPPSPGAGNDGGHAPGVDILAHQLMNTLNLACGFSELLAETAPAKLSREEARYLKETQSALRRAVQIAEELQLTDQNSRANQAPAQPEVQ